MLKLKNFFTKRYIIVVLLILFIGDDVLFLAPYIKGRLEKDDTEFFAPTASDKEIISTVVDASLNIEESQMIQQEYRGLKDDLRALFSPKRNSQNFNNYYMAYNLVGLSQYALKYNDEVVWKHLIQKADSWIGEDGKIIYELTRIDQCPIGIVYINLYRKTRNSKYLNIANQIYDYLKSHRQNGNIIPYNNTENNITDAVGMFVPFLMEYYDCTGDTLAHRIAIDNIEDNKLHGTDAQTHLPFHGYNIKTGIKLGSCNWGRGIGWFLLSVAYCPETNDSILQASVDKLPYTQFPLSSDRFDSSTALLFEIYKQSTQKNRKLSLDFIRTHIHKNGFVADCSGDTYAPNDYSHAFGNNELCNGLLLILYSKNFIH